MPRTFAYLHVSTIGQPTDNQLQEIGAAGFKVELRAWLAFISYKDRKTVVAALKQIYRACDGPQSNCALSEVGEGSCQRR